MFFASPSGEGDFAADTLAFGGASPFHCVLADSENAASVVGDDGIGLNTGVVCSHNTVRPLAGRTGIRG